MNALLYPGQVSSPARRLAHPGPPGTKTTFPLPLKRLLRCGLWALLALLACWAFPDAALGGANQGTFTYLAASDAPNSGDTVSVQVTVQADTRIERSNILLEVVAPDGTVARATRIDLPKRLEKGETWSGSWSFLNTDLPTTGTYTIRACWSMGWASTCNIAQAQTTFFSVPVLGWPGFVAWLGAIGLVLGLHNRYGQRCQSAQAA